MAGLVTVTDVVRATPDGSNEYHQEPETAPDVSEYTEAAIDVVIEAMNRDSSTVTLKLQTAFRAEDDAFVDLVTLKTISEDITEYPMHIFDYLNGYNADATARPGFGRYRD